MNSLLTPNLKAKLRQDIVGALMKLEDVCCLGNWGPNCKMDLPPVSFACNVDLFGFQMEVVLSTIYMQSVEQGQVKRAIANRITYITPVGVVNNKPWSVSAITELRDPTRIADVLLDDLPTRSDIESLHAQLEMLWAYYDVNELGDLPWYPIVGKADYSFDGLSAMMPKHAIAYVPVITHYNEENTRQFAYIDVAEMVIDIEVDYTSDDYYRMMTQLFTNPESPWGFRHSTKPNLDELVTDRLIVPLSISNHCRIIGG